jgi:transcriptional regulator with XRE-family HTH domain
MTGIGPALRRLRRLKGMKQSHVAEIAGVTQATVSRWESGAHRPTPEQAARLAPLLEVPLDPAADAALRRLVETSALPVHLVCDLSHRLLAASRPRLAEWRAGESELLGRSLWPYATDEIRRAEAMLSDLGWHEPAGVAVAAATGPNRDPVVRIVPGILLWERLTLSDGRAARLVTSVAPEALDNHAPGCVLLV